MKNFLFLIVAFVCFHAQAQVPSYVPTNGLVGYWPFSGNANDLSGNNNNGTVNGATLTTDRNGNANSAYSFDGINDFISLASYNFFLGNTSRSIAFWIQTNQTQNGIPVSIGTASYNNCFNVRYGAGAPGVVGVMGFTTDYYPTTGTSIINNAWHHVVVTHNGTTLKIYIDGILDNSSNKSYNTTGTNNFIGKSNQSGGESWVSGKIDNVGFWNRALTPQEITSLYNSCTTLEPTGNPTQILCATPTPTVANLTVTGTAIQWYAAATGGAPLATTATLVDGTTYYASQTVTGCESPTRLAVTVDFNDPQITASATTVCSGTAVTLTASTTATPSTTTSTLPANLQNGLVGYWPFNGNANDVSGNANNGTVQNGTLLSNNRFNIADTAYDFDGLNDQIEVNNNSSISPNQLLSINLWLFPRAYEDNKHCVSKGSHVNLSNRSYGIQGPENNQKARFFISNGTNEQGISTQTSIPLNQWTLITGVYDGATIKIYINGSLDNQISFSGSINITSEPLIFGSHKFYSPSDYWFNGKLDDIAIYNRVLSSTEIAQLYTVAPTYLWSTGETTATINPTPTATTTYWCDVTLDGVTCRKEVTINVNSTTPTPTGNANQVFCLTPAPTVTSLTAIGTAIQWYAVATGGSPLASTTALVDGTTYYASQTINGCESTTRLAVTVDFNDPQITASATTVCSGTPVTLSASSSATTALNGNLPANLQTGLVGYWPFNGNANDASGNSKNGTVNGATLTTDRFGNPNSAYYFNTYPNYIQFPEISNTLGSSNSATTISIWSKSNHDYPDGVMIHSASPGFQYQFARIEENSINKIKIYNRNPSTNNEPISTESTNSSDWNHIVAVIDGINGNYKLYINGNLSPSMSFNFDPTQSYYSNSRVWQIGAISFDQSYHQFTGKIDDLSIFNRALSQSEITQLYTAAPTYLWSTGETTATINPTPTATTTYWCDVTVNGVTCRKTITITVNPNIAPAFTQVAAICNGATLAALPTTSTNGVTGTWSPALNNTATTTYTFTPTAGQCAATATMTITVNTTPTPTGTTSQTFCATPAPTVASLTATGTGVQWYAAANGGTALATTTALVSGTTYYASQTLNACESTTRLAVTVTLNDPQITASATTICNGTPVTLSASTTATAAQNGNLPINLQTGLVGYWPFNGNANDESGNGLNGIVNGATLSNDRFGNANSAYSFDGINDRIIVNDNAILNPSQITLSTWVKLVQNGPSEKYIINKSYDPTPRYWSLRIGADGRLNVETRINNVYHEYWASQANGVISNNVWHHLVLTYDGQKTKLFLNSNLVLEENQTGTLSPFTHDLAFGYFKHNNMPPFGYFWDGQIDDVFFFNRALSTQEISQLNTIGQTTYAWSTGETTATINPTPTATTTYWCDVTVNGVTCRKEATINVNSTTPAPTGNATQVFCVTPAPTVASLTATGTVIQWYAAATGGSALASTTTLVDGTNYYASQTINGCESTTRLAVTVGLNDPQITASATTVCSGTAVTLTASTLAAPVANNCTLPTNLQNGLVGYWPFCGNANDASGNNNNGTVNGATLTTDRFGNSNSAYSFDGVDDFIQVANSASLNPTNLTISAWVKPVSYFNGNCSFILGKGWDQSPGHYDLIIFTPNHKSRFVLGMDIFNESNSIIDLNNWTFITATLNGLNSKFYINGVLENTVTLSTNNNIGVNTEDLFFGKMSYPPNYPYWLNGIADDIAIYNRALSDSEIAQLYTPAPTYLWSTGETTATINPTPTATTTYWCDVTVNGVTCRKEVTITVNSTTPAPTGTATQVFCVTPAPTVASLTATGTAVQWYAAATGGSPLASTTALVDGTIYYASQAINGCESTTRLAVTVDFNDPQITASATTVCSGTAVTLTAGTTATPITNNCTLPTNLQNGLIGYFPFCGNAIDESGNGHDGLVNNSILTSDRFNQSNKAYQFNSNSSIVFSNLVSNVKNNFSYSAWVNTTNSIIIPQASQSGSQGSNLFSNGCVIHPIHGISFGIQNNVAGSGLYVGNNGVYILEHSGGWEAISLRWEGNLTGWHLISVVYENKFPKLFIDGQYISTGIPSSRDIYISLGPDSFPAYTNSGVGAGYKSAMPQSTSQYFNGKIDDLVFFNRVLSPAEISQLYTPSPTYLWSTGETTSTINPTPTATTTYWCDVTVNGVTCRKEATINVNSTTPAPTGNATQVFCVTPAPTVASLTATGTAIQWYDVATGGSPLASTTVLVDGTTYYASQTVTACESPTRLAVLVDFNDPQITASATTVCSGTAVTLTASTTAAALVTNCTLPTNLQNGLVGYWPFCGNANDASGNNNNGTVNGATLTTDRFGNADSAYSFDGINDNIMIPGSSTLNTIESLNKITLAGWFNNQNTNVNSVFSFLNKYNPINDGGWEIILAQNYADWSTSEYVSTLGNGISNPCISTLPVQTWNHIAITYDRNDNTVSLFINGTNTCTRSHSNIISNTNNGPLYFGYSPAGPDEYSKGILDDINLFNRILTSAEIAQLYTQTTQTSYLWSTGATTSTINPIPATTTTYWCDVTVNGVTCRKEITINVTPNTVPTFTQVADICSGATLVALPTTSANGVTGTWSPALDNTATTTYIFTPDAGLCATTATMTINVNPNVTPTFTQVSPICSGATLAALPTTSNNGITGTWSPALDTNATTDYTFTPTVGLCATTAAMTITVIPNVTPTFTQVAIICSGATLAALPTTSDNGITGSWSPALDNTATTTYLFTPTTAQCATTATMTINVLPNVVPTFTQVAEICAGAALGALPTTSSNGVIGTWSPAINNMGTTTYTFTPTAGQCASTATMTITVNPNITPVFTQVPAICSGDTLSPLPTTSNNGITGTWSPSLVNTMTLTYTFTPTEGLCATTTTMTITVNRKITPLFSQMSAVCAGTTMTDLPTTSLNGVIGTWSPALNNMVTTTYTFTPAVGQCAFTKTMTVVVNPIPGTPSGATDQNFCQNDAPRINDIVINGSNVVWFASVTSNFPLSGLTYLIDGTTYYAGAYNPTTGCQSVNRYPVTVHITSIEAPVVEAQFTLCEEDNPTLASINTNGTSLVYYDAATNGNALAATFELVDGMVIYAAQIDLQTGCESVERSPIQIEINNCRLVIYNLITIDGNQANDRFRVENIENYPTNSVQIFNRNGQLIWKTDQYDNVTNAFIGKATEGFVLKGDEYLPTGTYFYVISYYDDYQGETKQVKGFIQIDNKK